MVKPFTISECLICPPKYPVLATIPKLTNEKINITNASNRVKGDFFKAKNIAKIEIFPKIIKEIKA